MFGPGGGEKHNGLEGRPVNTRCHAVIGDVLGEIAGRAGSINGSQPNLRVPGSVTV